MSSDSEDDCYGNIAQKLQTAKKAFQEDKINSTNLLIELKEKESTDYSWKKNDVTTIDRDCSTLQNTSQFSETADEISLDTIIANNSKKRASRARASKRPADIDTSNILPEKKTRSKRKTKNSARATIDSQNSPVVSEAAIVPPQTPEVSTAEPSVVDNVTDSARANTSVETVEAPRGRGRGRARGRQAARARQTSIQSYVSPNNRSRGRNSQRRGRRRHWDFEDAALYDLALAIAASTAMSGSQSSNYNGPIYSVGNTDEYPDQSDNQPLFSSLPKPQNDVVVVENDEMDEDNEELSIKVYWQSTEVVKFNIRKLQPLTTIFQHFSERENVPQDKLLFTYNDKILKSSDTPNSIHYSIVKFIDGGVINQSVTNIIQDCVDEGIKLKFQCQNVKKPYIASIGADEKMQVVMMKCAQHLEKPLESLKFVFDGDVISGKLTPRELELEGGECIDVGYIR